MVWCAVELGVRGGILKSIPEPMPDGTPSHRWLRRRVALRAAPGWDLLAQIKDIRALSQ